MIDWLLDLIPLWIWIPLAGVALLAAWRLLGLKGAIAAAGAVAALLAYRSGRQSGGADARAKQKRADEKAVKDHDRIEEQSERMSDADLDRANSAWLRDGRK